MHGQRIGAAILVHSDAQFVRVNKLMSDLVVSPLYQHPF